MFYVIQNQARVPLGAYAPYLAESGVDYTTVRLHADDALPTPAQISALLVLGGTMGVHEADRYAWMPPLQRLMRDVADSGTPLLGICLGGQLLAAALDGSVTANRYGERGIHDIAATAAGATDPLFAGLPASLPVMQWHHDSFDLPPGAVALASSVACPVQAFRRRNAYGLQFHPEVDAAVVADWSRDEADAAQIVATFESAQQRHGASWQRLFRNFLHLAGLVRPAN